MFPWSDLIKLILNNQIEIMKSLNLESTESFINTNKLLDRFKR